MNKSILVIDTPSSCNGCKIVSGVSSGGGMIIWQCPFEDEYSHEMAYNFTDKKLPNCPLISISIDELEEAVEGIYNWRGVDGIECDEEFNTIKSTIDKLKGVK